MKLKISVIYKVAVLTIFTIYSGGSLAKTSIVSIGDKVYNWNKWDCYDYSYDKHLLSIGYVEFNKLDKSDKKRFVSRLKVHGNQMSEIGMLFLNNSESAIYSDYFLIGTMHYWNWDDYVITIKPDGTGHYYDFTGVVDGQKIESSDTYKCIAR